MIWRKKRLAWFKIDKLQDIFRFLNILKSNFQKKFRSSREKIDTLFLLSDFWYDWIILSFIQKLSTLCEMWICQNFTHQKRFFDFSLVNKNFYVLGQNLLGKCLNFFYFLNFSQQKNLFASFWPSKETLMCLISKSLFVSVS